MSNYSRILIIATTLSAQVGCAQPHEYARIKYFGYYKSTLDLGADQLPWVWNGVLILPRDCTIGVLWQHVRSDGEIEAVADYSWTLSSGEHRVFIEVIESKSPTQQFDLFCRTQIGSVVSRNLVKNAPYRVWTVAGDNCGVVDLQSIMDPSPPFEPRRDLLVLEWELADDQLGENRRTIELPDGTRVRVGSFLIRIKVIAVNGAKPQAK